MSSPKSALVAPHISIPHEMVCGPDSFPNAATSRMNVIGMRVASTALDVSCPEKLTGIFGRELMPRSSKSEAITSRPGRDSHIPAGKGRSCRIGHTD